MSYTQAGFADALQGPRNAYNRLEHLPPSLRFHFVLGNPKESLIENLVGDNNLSVEMLQAKAKDCPVTIGRLEQGHLLVQENPKGLAEEMGRTFERWLAPKERPKL
jgi:hypothetical protein